MADRELLVLSGNAHPELAGDIATQLGIGLVNATVDQFPDEESRIKIHDNVRELDVFLIQPTGPPANHNIMETVLMIDALKRASAGRITAVIPYFGYARQDRKDASRVPISAKAVINLFEAVGTDRLMAVDLHAHQIQGFTDLPFDHLYAAKSISEVLLDEVDHPVVVSPDVGASKMARKFADRLKTDWAIVDKDRIDAETTTVAAIIGHSVVGRNAVIVDDMASTAGSLVNAAMALKEQGALQVVAAVTHGVLSGDAVKRIEDSEYLDLLYTTDTLPRVGESDKIRRITIAPLLARAIRNVHDGESVSGLF